MIRSFLLRDCCAMMKKSTMVAPRVLTEGFKRLVQVLRGHSLHWAVLVSIAQTPVGSILSKHEQFCKGKPIDFLDFSFDFNGLFSSSFWPWSPLPWPKNLKTLVMERVSSTPFHSMLEVPLEAIMITMITMIIMVSIMP